MIRGKNSNNTSGYMGVSWHAASKKWQAKIRINKQTKFIGTFSTPLEAHIAYLKEAKRLRRLAMVLD